MPVVSVIVPMYGVEQYLPDTLASLRAQTLRDVQIVLVDDDSPDGVAAIAKAACVQDPRVQYVHQSNCGPGPGGGRNGGLATATGEYVLFVDSDDVIAPDMLEVMVNAARACDADLVTCNTSRLVGGAVRRSEFHDIGHRSSCVQTTAAQSPWLMFDSTPWNKLFRRSFFDDVVGQWPEQVLYEDIAMMTRAHLRSKRTAVLTESFYYWRVRTDGQITETTNATDGDHQQLRELRRGADEVKAHGNDELLDWYSWKALGFDLHWMTRKLTRTDAESGAVLASDIVDTIEVLSPRSFERLPARAKNNYAILRSAQREIWRARLIAINGRLAPVSRGFDVDSIDPRAELLRWSVEGQTINVRVLVDEVAATSWKLQLGPQPLLTGPNAPVTSQVEGRITNTIRRGRQHVTFQIPLDDPALIAGPGVAYIAVLSGDGHARGEIGRSLRDRVKARLVSDDRAAPGPTTYVVPFFDNNRFALATNSTQRGVESAKFQDGYFIVCLTEATNANCARVGLHSNHRHEPLTLEPVGGTSWRVPIDDIMTFIEQGHPLLSLAYGSHESPAFTRPLRGLAASNARCDEVESVVGGYGQVFVRANSSLLGQIKPFLAQVRRERHIPGL